MERKIRRKFILFSSLSVMLMIVIVVGLTTLIGYLTTYSRLYSDLEYLCENYRKYILERDYEKKEMLMLPQMQYEFRYFIVTSGEEVKETDTSHFDISEEDAVLLAQKVLRYQTGRRSQRGTIAYDKCRYVYKIFKADAEIADVDPVLETGDYIIVFLDSTRTMYNIHRIIRLSVLIGMVSFFFFFLIISAFSGRAVKSTIKNIEAQNEFITNAGHELKTPLAIISANTEVIEMMEGKNEWTEEILHQVKHMNDLIGELIFLAKMNEKSEIVLQQVNLSSVTEEVTEAFYAVIEQQGKQLKTDITPEVEIKGEEKLLHELVSILVDNAVKYCDDEGTIGVVLKRRTKDTGAKLMVRNHYAAGKQADYSRFFDRFYREDISHNSKKKGYGIGLSMAEGIIRRLKGKISVSYHEGEIIFTVQFYT